MALNITNLFYSEKDIGATLKISKRQFIWEFEINGSSQRIELLDSRFSRKKRLYKNGVSILDTIETGNFVHNFEIDGHACVIIQYGDKIELRIDNQSFTHLYNLQKNKQLFAGEKGPTSNIYVAKPFNAATSSDDKKDTENPFYKNKPEEDNKPKLFNFEIKKGAGNKSSGGFNKFKFGGNKGETNSSSNNNIQNNNNNNNGNPDLLGIQNNQNANNNTNNNNNLLDFGANNNQNNQNQNQNQQPKGNDIFGLFGNNNNNQNQQNQNSNNNQFNNIFLQLTDGTNQQPKFDQNNLGFLNLNNNGNNNNLNNIQNQQINQNNSNNNQNNNGNNIDFLQF